MKLVAKVDVQALPAPIHEAYFNYVQTFWDHGLLDPQIKELILAQRSIKSWAPFQVIGVASFNNFRERSLP